MEDMHMASEKSMVQPARSGDPMEQVFEMLLPGVFRPMPISGEMTAPHIVHIDVIDRENEIVIRAEVSGVDKDKLDVQVHGNQVYISGTKADEVTKEEGKYIYRERRYGNFSRTVQLPVDVDSTNSKATYKDGVLELVLPKADSAKRKKIVID
jgi:HSP20 family protein